MNEQDYLMHYGIKGMKWGVRRFQNPDGTRTALGRQHEAELKGRSGSKSSFGERARSTAGKVKTALTSDKAKKAYKIAGAAVGVATVAAAAYMYGKNKKAVDSFVKSAASTALSSSKSSINAGRNYMSNAMDRAGAKARSGLTKAGIKARDLGYSAQAGAHLAKERLGDAAKSAKSAVGTARNVGSNLASDVGVKARSGLTKAGMKARDVGYSAQAGAHLAKERLGDAAKSAKSAVGTARNVGSNIASNAGAKARSGLTKAGMKARDLGYSAQAGAYRVGQKAKSASNTARNIGSNVASNVGSKARSATTRAGMTARSAVNSAREAVRSRRTSGEQWITKGAKSSPTTNRTAMDAYDALYKRKKK